MAQPGGHLKKLQAKIFRGQNTADSDKGDAKPTRSSSDPALTINIPNPVLTQSEAPQNGHGPPKMARPEPTSPKNEEAADAKSYRERLVEKLGPDYPGAERYRLEKDDKREKHWKRWGPYLSDRQWVRRTFPPARHAC